VSTLIECPSTSVIISAHTDSQGDENYNKKLAAQRAKSVAFFFAKRGIDVGRLRAISHGESQPIASNDTAEGRRQNRRVELEIQ